MLLSFHLAAGRKLCTPLNQLSLFYQQTERFAKLKGVKDEVDLQNVFDAFSKRHNVDMSLLLLGLSKSTSWKIVRNDILSLDL